MQPYRQGYFYSGYALLINVFKDKAQTSRLSLNKNNVTGCVLPQNTSLSSNPSILAMHERWEDKMLG